MTYTATAITNDVVDAALTPLVYSTGQDWLKGKRYRDALIKLTVEISLASQHTEAAQVLYDAFDAAGNLGIVPTTLRDEIYAVLPTNSAVYQNISTVIEHAVDTIMDSTLYGVGIFTERLTYISLWQSEVITFLELMGATDPTP